MSESAAQPAAEPQSRVAALGRRLGSPVFVIAASTGTGNFSSQFWMPFLPFFLLKIGATSDANALFWLAVALGGQGVGRILTGPAWGYLADRYGRKLMFVRALYAASISSVIAGLATAPWHVALAFTLQGALSGFVPAAVALTSVTVPRERLSSSLATVTAAQYLGTTVAPALGAVFASFLGFRGAILAGSLLPSIAAFSATVFIPRDQVMLGQVSSEGPVGPKPSRLAEFAKNLSLQLAVGIFLYFALYAASGVLRVAAPIAIKEILRGAPAATAVGVAYTASGFGSLLGALGFARVVIHPPRLRLSLTAVIALTVVAHFLLAAAGSVPLWTLWFALISVAQGAMVPSANTLIAASVSSAWRGTAFGLASSFQALAFIVGPASAAFFATFSLPAGFRFVGLLFLVTGIVVFAAMKEPNLEATQSEVG